MYVKFIVEHCPHLHFIVVDRYIPGNNGDFYCLQRTCSNFSCVRRARSRVNWCKEWRYGKISQTQPSINRVRQVDLATL